MSSWPLPCTAMIRFPEAVACRPFVSTGAWVRRQQRQLQAMAAVASTMCVRVCGGVTPYGFNSMDQGTEKACTGSLGLRAHVWL